MSMKTVKSPGNEDLSNQISKRPLTQSHAHDHDDAHSHPGHEHAFEILDIVRIGLVAVAVLASWFKLSERFAPFDMIAAVATVIGGYPIFREAFEAVRERRMTMELSMTIALGSAMAISEFFTALVIVLFVLIAEVLEGLTVGRGRRAIKDLLDLLPRDAVVRRQGKTQDIGAHALEIGDIVVVKPGSRIPVDGIVVSGNSFVDEATITGESFPAEKVEGNAVYAGTVNQSGALDVRTDRVGPDTAFGKIIKAVEEAEQTRAPIQKVADRLAGYLVYFAAACAVLTFILTRDMRSTISVIIVAGACGIAAGTPLAILGAIGRSARKGAIVKGGLYIEALGHVDTVVFDKTGTLTLGNPQVVKIRPATGVSETAVLEAAAIAERPSEHPLGKAILRRATDEGLAALEPQQFRYTPGKGISCSAGGDLIVVGNKTHLTEQGVELTGIDEPSAGSTAIYVSRGGRLLGVIEVADTVRPEAAAAVRILHDMGLRTVMLTGDARAVADTIGRSLGIQNIEAELLPQEKVDRVKALRASGRKIVMLGDGINDAPALMEADVGVAMGSGTDVARESADVLLIGNDLSKFVETISVARRCRRIIMANFVGTLVVDGLGVALAALGYLNPLLAAFIHVTSELAFILNSARLLPGAAKAES